MREEAKCQDIFHGKIRLNFGKRKTSVDNRNRVGGMPGEDESREERSSHGAGLALTLQVRTPSRWSAFSYFEKRFGSGLSPLPSPSDSKSDSFLRLADSQRSKGEIDRHH